MISWWSDPKVKDIMDYLLLFMMFLLGLFLLEYSGCCYASSESGPWDIYATCHPLLTVLILHALVEKIIVPFFSFSLQWFNTASDTFSQYELVQTSIFEESPKANNNIYIFCHSWKSRANKASKGTGMSSLLLINVSADSMGVLWKSGCFHFLMKRKCYISYSNLLPLRFCFKIFREGCSSSPLHREMHNTEIHVYWTMLDLPWKNRCTAETVYDKCRWRNRAPGTIGSAYNLPGCISVWRRRGRVFRKANLSFPWLHVKATMLYFSSRRSVFDSLDTKNIQLWLLFSPAELQHVSVLSQCPITVRCCVSFSCSHKF